MNRWATLLVLTGVLQHPLRAQDPTDDLRDLASIQESLHRGELSGVRTDLEDYLLDYPGSQRARLLLVEVLRRRGDYDRAFSVLAEFGTGAEIQDGVVRRQWHLSRADLLEEVGRKEEALEAAEAARAEAPEDVELLVRQIEILAASGQRARAFELLHDLPDVRLARDGDPARMLLQARARAALGHRDVANKAAVFAEKAFADRGDPRQVNALLILGELYRSTRLEDGNEALRSYRDALSIDSSRAEAHLGIARTYIYRMEMDKARTEVDAAFSINPRLPDAFAVLAELQLYQRSFAEALTTSEAGLEINPRHLCLLATRAAGLALTGHPEEGKAIAAMLAEDERYADGFRLIGDLVTYHYRFSEAIRYFERGIQADPGHALNYFGLARCFANLGQTKEALVQLEKFRERDPFRYPHAHNLKTALGTVASLVSVQRGKFVFLLDAIESPVLVPLLSRLYNEKWQDFVNRYHLEGESETPIQVQVFSRHNDFSARTVGFTGFGAVGVCFGHTFTLVSPRSELRGTFQFERTAVHELAHVVSLFLSRQRVPRWLTEGMSVYEEAVFAPYCDREMDLDLYNYFHSGEIIPVLELNRLFGGPKVMFGYYQSGLLCQYIVQRWGHDSLVEMLRRYGRDEGTAEVIQGVFGIPSEQLDSDFLEWLQRTRLRQMRVQPTYTAYGRKKLLDRLADESRLGGSSPDGYLLAQIAWAYHSAGREIDRDDFLNQALRSGSRDASADFLLAERAMNERNFVKARRHFEEGFARGGEEFFALLRYADLQRDDGDDESNQEQVLETLERAKQCFPRYVDAHNPYLQRSEIFSELGRDAEALAELEAYCDINESDSAPRWTLVDAALDREDHARAEKYLRELRAIDPFQRELHRKLALCERKLSRAADAIGSLELALAVDPATEPRYDPTVAEEVRRERDQRERAVILAELADLYVDLGEFDRASRAIEDARLLQPDLEELERLERILQERRG